MRGLDRIDQHGEGEDSPDLAGVYESQGSLLQLKTTILALSRACRCEGWGAPVTLSSRMADPSGGTVRDSIDQRVVDRIRILCHAIAARLGGEIMA
jgi:hypothetical protein